MEQENIVNPDFNIPYYIFEALIDYIELSAKGNCKTSKWHNIEALLGLAVVNKRLTREQANCLRNTYYREN